MGCSDDEGRMEVAKVTMGSRGRSSDLSTKSVDERMARRQWARKVGSVPMVSGKGLLKPLGGAKGAKEEGDGRR